MVRLEVTQEIETLLKHSSDGFLIADNKGTILFYNSAIEDLSGFSIKKYIGKNLKLLVDKKLISGSTALEAINKKKTVTGIIETCKGKKLLITSLPVINPPGSVERVVCNIRAFSIIQKKVMDSSLTMHAPGLVEFDEKFLLDDKTKSYNVVRINGSDDELVYMNEGMKRLVEMAINLSQFDSTVLIYGETGAGKELIANLIHYNSRRANYGSFIKVNCASIPVSLIESELFGYEQGSFTGALKQGKKGYFEQADGGTLLLDEISELPLEVQAKLLRVLQEKRITRIGDGKGKLIDVRIIAATNQHLERMVREGKFREDLYFRLNVVPIEVPPLRNRLDDIPVLFHYFVTKFSNTYGISNKEISRDVADHLLQYPWPGNVRELANLVERLLVTTPTKTITPTHLAEPYSSCSSLRFTEKFLLNGAYPLEEIVGEFELAVVKKALEQSKTYAEATKILGISLSSLMRKLKKLKQVETKISE